jgi:SAM-dependent methyltransferase
LREETERLEEVHLWRGSAEQRALRPRAFKSSQFAYFDRQLGHPSWRGKTVLDFGGSAGYLLLNPGCAIRQEDYYCLDVVRDAVEEGRERFPDAHFVHYDRYNCSFNPEGTAGLQVPRMGVEFDFVLAYSVFTHTGRAEMDELVSQLRALLAPGGALAFTFIDPHHRSWPRTYGGNNLGWRLERVRETDPAVDAEALLEQSRVAEWCSLVGGAKLFVGGDGVWDDAARDCMTYNVYYTEDFMRREFPRATILPPVNDDMQHCCVIREDA